MNLLAGFFELGTDEFDDFFGEDRQGSFILFETFEK